MYLGKQFDKSLEYYRKVIAFYEGKGQKAARKNIAMCRKGMGNVFSAMKDYAAAKEAYRLALDY